MKYRFLALIFGGILLILSQTTTSEVYAQSDSDATITVSLRSDAATLDPHGSNDQPSEIIRHHIFERLLIRDDNNEITGVLAEDWEQVDDVTYQFNLREGVEFHDGTPFNAEVAKENLDRAMDPAVASGKAYLLENVDSVNVVDEYTLEIVTTEVYAPMLSNLAQGVTMMMSQDVIRADYENAFEEAGLDLTIEEYYELREAGGDEYESAVDEFSAFIGQYSERNPIGTGKLQFESRTTGSETVLTRFDDHWDGPVSFGSAVFKVVPEQGARIAELETGSTDIATDIDTTNMTRVEETDGLSLLTSVSPGVLYLGFNTEVEELSDPLVRRAISHAINREEIIEGVFNGVGHVAATPISETMSGYSDANVGNTYDLELAQELLAESEYPDGFDIEVIVNAADNENINTVLYIQEALAELGIDLTVNQVEWATFLETTAQGNQELFIMTWTNSAEESDNAFTAMFHSDSIGSAANRFRYNNPDMDELIEAGRAETDTEARAEIYQEAQNLLLEDSPAVFIRHPEYINGVRDEVTGIKLIAMGIPDLMDAVKE
ncbi:MAG TPA: ABC transporter substrate-binding protein [Aliicoccus persicus]|uniref:ABC transporter substrate-binding protein n=1 Tax=Aliicoccus persicus TaxID=930138 RepID=A0A921JB22_9STAP|nr:ABC transporter substrate-binding protein [Aliicoccus persicus]